MDTNMSSATPIVKSDAPDLANARHASDPILAEHVAEIRRLGKRTIEDVMEIGRLLLKCKEIVGHGNWLTWLDQEFGWSEATARNFMRVHELAQSTSVNFADLSLPVSTLYLLAAPSTPDAACTEIFERAGAGEQMSPYEVKETIAEAKRAKAGTPEFNNAENVSAEHVLPLDDHTAAEPVDGDDDMHEDDDPHHTTEAADCEPAVSRRSDRLTNKLTKTLHVILKTTSPTEQVAAIAKFNKALDQEGYDFNDVEVRLST